MGSRLFLLSPASCSGRRASLLCASTRVPLAERLRAPGGAPIGEVFSFISQLYFRGKLAYARAFAQALDPATVEGRAARAEGDPDAVEGRGSRAEGEQPVAGIAQGIFVITTSRGLVPPAEPVTVETLREFASVDLKTRNAIYTRPLEAGARRVASRLGPEDSVVLLGSIATDKYVEVLLRVLGDRLLFPREFVGRGDMSRGGLMLRCAREGRELEYVPLEGAVRHGVRPPRLTS